MFRDYLPTSLVIALLLLLVSRSMGRESSILQLPYRISLRSNLVNGLWLNGPARVGLIAWYEVEGGCDGEMGLRMWFN